MIKTALDYDFIFFDLDGTLSDSAPGIMECLEKSLEQMGVEVPDRSILIRYIGPPLVETFSLRFGLTGEKLDEVMELFRGFYKEIGLIKNDMYPGVPEMLKRLSAAGKRLAVATSKREYFARIICERYGISQFFEIIAGNSDDMTRATKEEVIEYILATLKIDDRSRVLMVGDRLYDVEGANKSGLHCMGVLHGYGSRQELLDAGARYIAQDPLDAARQIIGE